MTRNVKINVYTLYAHNVKREATCFKVFSDKLRTRGNSMGVERLEKYAKVSAGRQG